MASDLSQLDLPVIQIDGLLDESEWRFLLYAQRVPRPAHVALAVEALSPATF
jgi:hypothetical protein